jgi:hypothetical protein
MRQLLPVVFLLAAAMAAILALRRGFGRVLAKERVAEAEKILPFLIGTVGGYYGLLTGFILSGVWGDVQTLRRSSMAEINALAELDRIAVTLPGALGTELKSDIGAYLRSVIDQDLKAMAGGRVSAQATDVYGRLWTTVARPRPTATPWESYLLGRALDKVGVVGEQRRTRILINDESLPAIVWGILLIGAAIILSGASIVSLRYGSPVREILIAVAAMLSVVLFAIYAMDRPFRHGYGPAATRYEMLYEAYHAPVSATHR